MKKSLPNILFLLFAACSFPIEAQNVDSLAIKHIFNDALTDTTVYHNLRELTGNFPGRLAGSEQSVKAVKWVEQTLKQMELDSVYLMPCKVRQWDHGEKEQGNVISAKAGNHTLQICSLGGSVPTGDQGITAKVIEVKDFAELRKFGKEKINGKIVFFNHPADPTLYTTFAAYGGAVAYRVRGAVMAAYYGAIAMVDRSSTTSHDNFPHTGIQHYADTVNKIPALSISTNDADNLSRWLKVDPDLNLYLKSSCSELHETTSWNVIGEIRGTEHPDQFIAFGGHLDCWYICQGANDDGAGVVQSMDVLRLFKSTGLKPSHTLRAVIFMDEEMEQGGGKAYAEAAKGMKHIAAIEADRGGSTPFGFAIDGTDNVVKKVQSWKNLLLPYGLYSLEPGGSGTDIHGLKAQGITLFGLVVDSQRYFDYHHSVNDSFDKINVRELQLGSASMGALVFLIDKYGL
jgi:carboxypeptidase Q